MPMLIFAVVLAVMQAVPPVPRKAPDNQASQADKRHGKANASQDTATEPISSTQPPSAPHGNSTANPAAPSDTGKTIIISEPAPVSHKDAWDKTYVIFTGLLVSVGFFGIYYARRTLLAIRSQLGVLEGQLTAIRHQVGEMTAQRGLMGRQLTTMDNQVAEMKDQTEALNQSVAVAKESADAALLGVGLQKVAMEQWIDTEDWEAGPIHIQDTATEAFLPIKFAVMNTTKFKMFLNRVEVWIDRQHAVDTYFRKQLLTPDGGSTNVEIQRQLTGMKLESYRKGVLRFEIGGIVYYVDAFGKEQEQRFGFHCECRMNQSAEFKAIAFDPPDAIEIEQQKRRKAQAQQKEAN